MSTNIDFEVPILVAGGGSTGLSLAGELGWRGTPCMLVEPRVAANPHPRANAVANRSMEYFRRWDVAHAMTGAGVPADYPAAYYWVSTLHGHEIHRLTLPGHAELERMRAQGAADPSHELHWSPYLKTIVGQHEVERVLREHVARCASVDAHFGWELESFEERAGAVRVSIRNELSNEVRHGLAGRLVACDGGRSRVREALGIRLQGRASLARFVSIYFRAPEFMQCHRFGPANIFFPIHRKHRGFLLNWDTGQTWTYHLILEEGMDWSDVQPEAAIESLLGCRTPLEVVSVQPWTAHALTAEHYQSPHGRVFLAGDAAHLFTPTGGLGMNTGVSDAIDLAWKLGAEADGWAGPSLLPSYEAERHTIGVRNTREAADNFDRLFAVMQWGDELDDPATTGETLRAALRADLVRQEKLLKSSGVLLGYRYEGSPICWDDDSEPTPDDPQAYVPTARPGHRAPHAWLTDGRSVLDLMGPWFTLLCFDGDTPTARALCDAAAARGVPLAVQLVNEPSIRALYGGRAHVLVRPDLMVGWRGDDTEDAGRVIDRLRGA
jgi:2-polyprenyl-6-methoxyphenol hydroxylase-like FAD-dependent oxidoreductase